MKYKFEQDSWKEMPFLLSEYRKKSSKFSTLCIKLAEIALEDSSYQIEKVLLFLFADNLLSWLCWILSKVLLHLWWWVYSFIWLKYINWILGVQTSRHSWDKYYLIFFMLFIYCWIHLLIFCLSIFMRHIGIS